MCTASHGPSGIKQDAKHISQCVFYSIVHASSSRDIQTHEAVKYLDSSLIVYRCFPNLKIAPIKPNYFHTFELTLYTCIYIYIYILIVQLLQQLYIICTVHVSSHVFLLPVIIT